ncbi:MAG: iron-sulfur cluster assembly scaffold protein [Candidatus Sungbacteria bacterium]|nr:iron-sulfur cluster assembly scaffold protein [Candidatus Sungbacteria bacterium]
MSDRLYSEKILAHYHRPLNYGLLAKFDVQQRFANPLCGDIITVQLRFEGDQITSARFKHDGCVISRAAASLLCQDIQGRAAYEIHAMSYGDIEKLLGVSVMPARIKCATLALETIQRMV